MIRQVITVAVLSLMLLPLGALAQTASWPEVGAAPIVGGGEGDAAVVVGIENYAFVPRVAGARSNADAWHDWLTRARKVPVSRVALLRDSDASVENIRDAVVRAAGEASPQGTLWFVFVGHGAPREDGKDGLLLAVDVQQTARSLASRGLARGDLLKLLSGTRAGSIRVVLDACFSGKSGSGEAIVAGLQPLVVTAEASADRRFAILTAARSNQYAGALPGTSRPAFSYLVLGGLRGWADEDGDGNLTAGELQRYAESVMRAVVRDRDQTPTLLGDVAAQVARSGRERGPDLAALARRPAGGMNFEVTALPALPTVARVADFDARAGSLDLDTVDVDAMEMYDKTLKLDKSGAAPAEKIASWQGLSRRFSQFREMADRRAAEWENFVAQQKAAEEARLARGVARDKDWARLARLLPLEVIKSEDKRRWAAAFVAAYGKKSSDNPYVASLADWLPAGTVDMLDWVLVPGGSFQMGSNDGAGDEKPVHQVTVPTFEMTRSEVTFGQYQSCVSAGACTPAHVSDGSCYVWNGSSWAQGNLGAGFQGKDQPVVCVDWDQANAFARWVGGRLPTEAEWEYAARSGGRNQKYPWGDKDANCNLAVMNDGGLGCGRSGTWPVCSKAAGNTVQGLCDMAGNVWEWVQDWYHESYGGAPTDGRAWESPAGSFRVGRGGSWYNGAGVLRSAFRSRFAPGFRNDFLGFRVLRLVTP
jgi:formylglycine-generating enzyme required for sulfatase activity/uncharacterized caspase-like protein